MSVFAGHEGWVYVWTGAANQSGSIIQYAESFDVNFQRAWANEPSVSGVYRDHLTNRRADATLGGLYAYGNRLHQLANLETAVHMKIMLLDHTGSAGVLMYSGRIDGFSLNGMLGQNWKHSLQYHANIWSAFNA